MGYVSDDRIKATLKHLLDTQYNNGGWRCNKFSFGIGEETEDSNPLPTLLAINAFRFSDYLNKDPVLESSRVFT